MYLNLYKNVHFCIGIFTNMRIFVKYFINLKNEKKKTLLQINNVY